jgi:DNA-binding MarR family transcriptional regulator
LSRELQRGAKQTGAGAAASRARQAGAREQARGASQAASRAKQAGAREQARGTSQAAPRAKHGRAPKEELARRLIYEARASQAATERFDALACEALGINRTDAACLDILDNEGGVLTAGRLAELSGLTTAAVTAVVDRLEAKGYARRVRDEKDRRRVLVEATDLLRERTEPIWGPLAGEGTRALQRLTVDELATVTDYFRLSRELNERHAERIRGLRFE